MASAGGINCLCTHITPTLIPVGYREVVIDQGIFFRFLPLLRQNKLPRKKMKYFLLVDHFLNLGRVLKMVSSYFQIGLFTLIT